MDAYIEGLEQRMASGSPVSNIASVASFFISRVDNEIDKRLDQLGTPSALALRGTAAVNQARLAYAAFQKTFSGPRWEALAKAGASVQRPLWASTSTKNPSYPDTMYVDELIGAHSVNTLPDATMDAFSDHGSIAETISSNVESAHAVLHALEDVGIDMTAIADQLEAEGVVSFQQSFNDLLAVLEAKRN
jgi:transaldolase